MCDCVCVCVCVCVRARVYARTAAAASAHLRSLQATSTRFPIMLTGHAGGLASTTWMDADITVGGTEASVIQSRSLAGQSGKESTPRPDRSIFLPISSRDEIKKDVITSPWTRSFSFFNPPTNSHQDSSSSASQSWASETGALFGGGGDGGCGGSGRGRDKVVELGTGTNAGGGGVSTEDGGRRSVSSLPVGAIR